MRPRWVWGGLLLALIGAATLGLGIAVTRWWPSVVGAVLLLLGVAASFAGGMMHDATPSFWARQQMHEVATGDVHEGVTPANRSPVPLPGAPPGPQPFLPDGIAMFEGKYADQAQAEIDERTRQALDGIPRTLAAIRRIAESPPAEGNS